MTTFRNFNHSSISLFIVIGAALLLQVENTLAFSTGPLSRQQQQHQQLLQFSTTTTATTKSLTALNALYSPGRSSSSSASPRNSNYNSKNGRSKRQERVGQLVRTELGNIIHTGNIKGDYDLIDGELRKRISIVSVDVSPDLRQARISVSVRASKATAATATVAMTDDEEDDDEDEDDTTAGISNNNSNNNSNAAVDKRRAYSWLVENTKALRHTLAQRMSHMKTSPNLTFVQVDVGAAVDVMYLIDKVTKGYERGSIGEYGGDDNSLPRGYVSGMDFDEEFDEDEWEDEDDDFFVAGSGGGDK